MSPALTPPPCTSRPRPEASASVADLPLRLPEKIVQLEAQDGPCKEQGVQDYGILLTNSAKRVAVWRKATFPPSDGLQGGAALWRSPQLLCPGLEAKMGSAETCGWTTGRGDRTGVLTKNRGFYLTIPSLENKHRPDEDPKASQASFPLWGWGPWPLNPQLYSSPSSTQPL